MGASLSRIASWLVCSRTPPVPRRDVRVTLAGVVPDWPCSPFGYVDFGRRWLCILSIWRTACPARTCCSPVCFKYLWLIAKCCGCLQAFDEATLFLSRVLLNLEVRGPYFPVKNSFSLCAGKHAYLMCCRHPVAANAWGARQLHLMASFTAK